MSVSNKKQPYPYSLVTAAWTDTEGSDGTGFFSHTICDEKCSFYLTPPRDAITIENLWTHIVLEFHASVDPTLRKIEQVGIQPSQDKSSSGKFFQVDKFADALGRIDLRLDLSALLVDENVGYFDFTQTPVNNGTYVYVKMPDALASSNSAVMLLWKVDALFTTQGIR